LTALIRNFSIIAHIDHGKSTLADRLIQYCGGLSDREMQEQVLDSMELEKERGITIKAQSVCLEYVAQDKRRYKLNLIDTPGHVDFSYEVSRSLAACEGALLVVDASQGVEAQSVATCYTAIEQGLEVVPVLNKIDLPLAAPDKVKHEIEEIIGIDASASVYVSAKTGVGIQALLERIVATIPAPLGDKNESLKALIIDSWFDNYVGVVVLVRIMHGILNRGGKILSMSNGLSYQVEDLGVFTPKKQSQKSLSTGEVGYLIAGIKDISAAKVGDTFTSTKFPATEPLPGFTEVQAKVFAGLYPVNSNDFDNLRDSLEKLKLNDAALQYEPETSQALGFGFRCGFLGTLHMEIVQQRLEREFSLELITTAPTVIYEVMTIQKELIQIHNPSELPSDERLVEIREPFILASMLVPDEYLGSVIELCQSKRGIQTSLRYVGGQVSLEYQLPLSEVVLDFFDKLKSASRGYASFDYTQSHFEPASLVKLDVLINSERIDVLSVIVHKSVAQRRGRELVEKMKDIIPRQMFDVAIQAAIGRKIIARSTVKALRKNVTAKCYGGDVTRKRKLLEKQKAGKRRMKQIGKVNVPQEAFLAILQIKD